MGKTTANLPLAPGQHYERCPGCGTVYRTKREQRFRCPACHRLAYAVASPAGEEGMRRTLEGDPTVYRVLPRRRQEGETAPEAGSDVVMFLEEPGAPAPAPELPPGPAPAPPGPAPLSRPSPRGPEPSTVDDTRGRARAAGRGDGLVAALGRWWRGE